MVIGEQTDSFSFSSSNTFSSNIAAAAAAAAAADCRACRGQHRPHTCSRRRNRRTVLGKRMSDLPNKRPAKRSRKTWQSKRLFKTPVPAVDFFSQERRQIQPFKAELDAIPASDRKRRTRDWWKVMSTTDRKPYIAQQKADKIRWTRDAQCYAVLHDVLNDVSGSKIPNPYPVPIRVNKQSQPKSQPKSQPESRSSQVARYDKSFQTYVICIFGV